MTIDDPYQTVQVPSPTARLDRRPFWDARANEPRSPERDIAPATLDAIRWLEFGAWEVPPLAWPTTGEYLDRLHVLADAWSGGGDCRLWDHDRLDDVVHSLCEAMHDLTGRRHFLPTEGPHDRQNLVAQAAGHCSEGYRLIGRFHRVELQPLVKWRQPTLL